MMRTDMAKGQAGFNMMGDVFAFLKKYGVPEKDNDAYWGELVDEQEALCDKYRDNAEILHLLQCITSGIMSHLEGESKKL